MRPAQPNVKVPITIVAMSIAGAIPVTSHEHYPIDPRDCAGHRPELQHRNRRDLLDPFIDVDRQLLDEMLARSLVRARRRSWQHRRAALAAAGILATLILAVLLAERTLLAGAPRPASQPVTVERTLANR
jgi:hypothetical protein